MCMPRKPQKEFLLSEQTGQQQQSNICFISVYFLLKDHLGSSAKKQQWLKHWQDNLLFHLQHSTSTGEGRRFNNLKAARVASRRGAIWKSDCDTFSAASVFSNSLFHCHYHQNRHGKQIYQFIFNISQKEEEATSLVGQNSTLVLRENDSGSLSCHDVFGTLHCQTLSSRLKAEPDIKRDLPTRTKPRKQPQQQPSWSSSASSLSIYWNFMRDKSQS